MSDIAPDLLRKIQNDFQKSASKDKKLQRLLKLINSGDGTYADAHDFSVRLSELLVESYGKYLSSDVLPDGRMYYNIANKLLDPTLRDSFTQVSDVCAIVQETLNKSANLNLQVLRAEFNEDRLEGLINRIASEDNFDDIAWILDDPITNFLMSVVKDSIKKNAELDASVGLSPVIRRIAANRCCSYCAELEGTYDYFDEVPDDVWRRHKNCRCQVLYDPLDGKVTNVHTKKTLS